MSNARHHHSITSSFRGGAGRSAPVPISSMKKCGMYLLDEKNGVIMLPPELAAVQQQQKQQHQSLPQSQRLASTSEERPSELDDPNVSPLSSWEMNSAMMGETATAPPSNGVIVGIGNVVGNVGRDGAAGDGEGDDYTIKTEMLHSTTTTTSNTELPTTSNEETTFRSDVRNDWVDAVFGRDFFPLHINNNNNEGGPQQQQQQQQKRPIDISVKQGIGLSGIPHYVTYGAILDPNSHSSSSSQALHTNATPNASSSTATNQQHVNNKTPNKHKLPFLSNSALKTQSTPLVFSSPSNLSLVGTMSGIVASTSMGSLTGKNNGNVGGKNSMTEDQWKIQMDESFLYSTPNHSGRNNNATYTTESTPGTTTTPYHNNPTQPKMGATISRISLGLYVRSISTKCEGYTAGISPGSILVDVNGMGMLGETSHRGLERLWRYDGTFVEESGGVGGGGGSLNVEGERGVTPTVGTGDGDGKGSNANNDLQMKKPVVLRLYKNGKVYTALLLSGKPLSGIEWAPCGNFALVQRSSGLAAECGVRRGCLVVGVDGEGLRTLDHVGVAFRLKEKFQRGETITISLGYTPAASRSGFYERDEKNNATPQVSNTRSSSNEISAPRGHRHRSTGDVEVRSRPVEYSSAVVDTFFACAGPSAMGAVMDGQVGGASPLSSSSSSSSAKGGGGNVPSVIVDVAAFVASGGILPPGGVPAAATKISAFHNSMGTQPQRQEINRRIAVGGNSNFSPCPQIEPECLLGEWNPLSSLAQSMTYHAAGCCETTYVEAGGPFGCNVEAAHSPMECMGVINGIAKSSPQGVAEGVFDAHLLQLLGVAISTMMGEVAGSATGQSIESAQESNQRLSEQLFDILIDVVSLKVTPCNA
jgi:hypothetical protein